MKIRHYFVTGLLVLMPIIITIYILSLLVGLLGQIVQPLADFLFGGPRYGLEYLAALLFILLVGIIATNVLGKRLINFGERLLGRIPVIRQIYVAVKQLTDTLTFRNKTAFKRVVVFEYPRRGVFQIGFVTYRGLGEIQDKTGENLVHIFLPTTPNPTSGHLVFIPLRDVKFLDMSVEEGLKLVFSAGALNPLGRKQKGEAR